MRAAEAERRAAAAEERLAQARAATSVAETAAEESQAQQANEHSELGSQRRSSYKTRPWSGKDSGSAWQRGAKEQHLSSGDGSLTGGVEWMGANRRDLFA